ncbi:MAG: nucleoside-diphosphate-sugar epimerase [Rhodothermales bacterium]
MSRGRIAIFGCGWLGKPLAEALVADSWEVRGSTRASDLPAGVQPYHFDLRADSSPGIFGDFFAADIAIIAFPPGRSPDVETRLPAQVAVLAAAIAESATRHVIFTSSTSVYPSCNQRVDETCTLPPDKASGRALLAAESALRSSPGFDCSIVRLAGLIGPGRCPGNFLAGKTDVRGGDCPVNLIHQADVIGIVREVIAQNAWDKLFNAVADEHPARREYYTEAAHALGLQPPRFCDATTDWKIIDNGRLKSTLDFRFRFPNPATCLYA